MNFTSAIGNLYAELGSPIPATDHDLPLSLIIDDRWELSVDRDPATEEILVSVPVPAIGMDELRATDAALKLLTLSLLGAQTGGCSLSVSPETQCLVVWRRHPDHFTGEQEATELLEAVVSAAAFMETWCRDNLSASLDAPHDMASAHAEDTTGWFKI